MTPGTVTSGCAVHPNRRKVWFLKAFLEVLSWLVKVERRREEMVDLQRVDWIIEGNCCGFGRSVVGFLGLLHLRWSAIVEFVVSAAMKMLRQRC